MAGLTPGPEDAEQQDNGGGNLASSSHSRNAIPERARQADTHHLTSGNRTVPGGSLADSLHRMTSPLPDGSSASFWGVSL
jgi:hypothetical protein